MTKIALSVVLITGAILSASAQTKGDPSPDVTLRGYVVDVMCGDVYAAKKNPIERAKAHTRACALEEACSASGYGVITNSGWEKFDAEGNVKAKKAIEASKRTRGLLFDVSGRRTGSLLSVTALKEIGEDKDGASNREHEGHKH